MITLRSTKNCSNTTRIMFALEELGLEYVAEIVEDGVFSSVWGSPGPTLHDGEVNTIEPGAIFRHLVRRAGGTLWPATLAGQAEADRWIEFLSRRLSRAIENKDREAVLRLLGFLDARLSTSQWIAGDELTMADVAYAHLAIPQARAMLPLAQFPNLSAYLERLASRPAFTRATDRYASSQR